MPDTDSTRSIRQQARREAHRILRDCQRSMRRSIAEAERLLALAGDEDPSERDLRRVGDLEILALVEPELAEGLR